LVVVGVIDIHGQVAAAAAAAMKAVKEEAENRTLLLGQDQPTIELTPAEAAAKRVRGRGLHMDNTSTIGKTMRLGTVLVDA
jgi:hypothetical protein